MDVESTILTNRFVIAVLTISLNSAITSVLDLCLASRLDVHTEQHRQARLFTNMAVLTFINIAIIVFLCSVNTGSEDGALSLFRILQGDHDDFKMRWYFDAGVQLCLNIMGYLIVSNMYEVTCASLKSCQRCCDRGCKYSLSDAPERPQNFDQVQHDAAGDQPEMIQSELSATQNNLTMDSVRTN